MEDPDSAPLTFYVDDSVINIEGKPHTVLGGVSFRHLTSVALQIANLKKEVGLGVLEEIKWNTKGLSRESRYAISDGIMNIIAYGVGSRAVITILEGFDKDRAAELLVTQMQDFCAGEQIPAFMAEFDENIVASQQRFGEFLRTGLRTAAPPCIGFHSTTSTHNPLLQVCDIFLGLYKTALVHALENRSKTVTFYDDGFQSNVTWPLSSYILLGTRHVVWGDHSWKTEDDVNSGEPYVKRTMGYGLRLQSSVSDGAKKTLAEIGMIYMGCLH
jgi:hypothetical protein